MTAPGAGAGEARGGGAASARRGARAHRAGLVRTASLGLCLALALQPARPSPAHAQQRPRPAAPKEAAKEPPKEAAPADVPAPYDRDLLRMSEIVGALAFLRGLCAAPDAAEWPTRMKALLEAEGVTPARRDRLAGAYNRGYRGYALTYRVCTPAAHEAASRFLSEGDRLSHALAGRFGG